MEYRKGLIFILIMANIILSAYLSYTYFFNLEQFCLTGEGCTVVQNSDYSKIIGIPIAYLGFTSFVALFLIYLLAFNKKIEYKYFLAATIFGSIGAVYFIYLQAFAIKAYCSNCIATEIIMFLITCLSIYDYYKSKKH